MRNCQPWKKPGVAGVSPLCNFASEFVTAWFLTLRQVRLSVPFMSSREPVERHLRCPSRSSAVLLLLLAVVLGCAPRITSEKKKTVTGADFTASKPSSGRPVVAGMQSAPPEATPGGTFEILVRVEIAGAHHLYASNVVGQPFLPVALDLILPDGVEASGDWIGPEPTRRRNGEFIYTDSVLFRRTLKVRVNVPAGSLSIKGELHYQTCTEELCWPPRTIQLSSSVSVYSPKR